MDFSALVVGNDYERPQLAVMWGYASFHAFSKGVFTPRGENVIVLFVTAKNQPALTQYQNSFDGDLLWMDGEKGHKSDKRLAESAGRDQVQFFYRSTAHAPFKYHGQVELVEAFLTAGEVPSRFIFTVRPDLLVEANDVISAELDLGTNDAFTPEGEGRAQIRLHVVYERSKKNRARALQLHGHTCSVCGFDFDAAYGGDLARRYIEVHHARSITELKGQVIDPQTELFPLCANCHRMAHRRHGIIVPLDELRERVNRLRTARGSA